MGHTTIKQQEYEFFSSENGIFMKIDHFLGHNRGLNKFKIIQAYHPNKMELNK